MACFLSDFRCFRSVEALGRNIAVDWYFFRDPYAGCILTVGILRVAGVYPRITGRAFVSRIRQLSECSASSFVIGAIYLERLRRHDEAVMLSVGTFRRLFLVSVMVAAKFLDDQHVSNRQVSILYLRI